MAVIFRACSLPGCGKWLARVASANNINWSDIFASQFSHVVEDRDTRPMFRQHLAGERLDLAEGHGLEPARAFQAEGEAADAAEKIKHFHHQNSPCAWWSGPLSRMIFTGRSHQP